ncbi:MAG TPA: molybdopterin-binding protein [Deltaproteobacteria bacterium]|mgnify:CR=1 FL=1|nr:molybdopterin-binding protein [Deltaproteobacteria bacterium]
MNDYYRQYCLPERKDDNMREIRVEEAIGTVLAHDMTRIVPGRFKGVQFKKGHVIRHEDIPVLLKMGKKHLYVMEKTPEQLHEDDAARRIASALCGDNLKWTEPHEGKIKITAATDGLLKIDVDALLSINSIGEIIVSTIKTGMPCKKDQVVAATRIIPLVIERKKIEQLEDIAGSSKAVLQILPYTKKLVGLVVTGSEVYEGLVKDESDRFIVSRLRDYGCELLRRIVVTDDAALIAAAIRELKEAGCELILTSGGLSVDPDDVTRKGVRASGARIISYGCPVLPGGMFLNALLGDIPILGLPACVFFNPRTVYDLMLPKILAGEQPTVEEVAAMGHGGMCMECEVCHFPVCPYGR